MKELLIRTLSALVFTLLMVSCILWCKWSFAALFAAVLAVMIYEYLHMTMGKSFLVCQVLAILDGICIFFLSFWYRSGMSGFQTEYVMIPLLLTFAVSALPLFYKDKKNFRNTACLLYSLLYIALPFSILNFGVFDSSGAFSGVLVLCMFIMVWASDVGAYAFGMLLGQKYGPKLCPDVSPHKSWIGFFGGMLLTIVAAFLIRSFGFIETGAVSCLIFAIVVHVAGVFGDLVESMWKRSAGIKDSGNCIPGHGGMMDRFDSASFAVPAGILFLYLANVL